MADKRIAGTLFVDMKYIFLYHKLGYKEETTDIYSKKYGECKIVILSEEQKFIFANKEYTLTNHSDFVILELLDTLLTKGYDPNDVQIFDNNLCIKGSPEVNILCEQWGNDYYNRIKSEHLEEMHAVYTSKLSGGLIERMYVFHYKGITQNSGLIENADLFDFTPLNKNTDVAFRKDFIVKNGVLIKYIGNNSVVSIPDGILKIDNGAFWNNISIKNIIIPDSVTIIGGDAFAYCINLENLNLPKNLCDIGDNPFIGCLKLKIKNESENFILDDGVLFTKDRTRLIHYTPSLPQERYEIPESVEWIGKHSFYNCNNLKEIHIGKNVNFIGNNPFSDCHNLVLKNDSPHFAYIDGSLLNKEKTTLFHYSHGRDADEYVLPDSVKVIGRNSFWNCNRIKKVTLGKNLRQIGYNPFANCTNLIIESNSPNYVVKDGILYDKTMRELVCCTNAVVKPSMNIPDTIENIGRNSFAGCTSLKNIDISDSVTTVSRGAFSNCGLESVYIPDSVNLIEKWAFSYCNSLKDVSVRKDTTIENGAFTGSNNVKVRYR